MYGHLRATFWFLCLILFLVAHPSFHLHWWWSNHEHALPQPTGSEKSRCLVSVGLISGRSWFPYVSVCSRASFMGRLNADSHLFLLLCFPQVGSQEQPRAMEQNGAHSTVQSMNSYPLFTQILFRFFFFLQNSQQTRFKAYFFDNTYLSCYHVAKSMLPCHTDCACLCIFLAVCC